MRADSSLRRLPVSAVRSLRPLPEPIVEEAVVGALKEDLGLVGDITTRATIPAEATANAMIVARAPGRIAGLQCAETTFHSCDSSVEFTTEIPDGADVQAGDTIASISGSAAALLTGERTALNFLCHLSGIATLTARYVKAIEGTNASICCTRKTTPGLRALEKYAVRAGGGQNHRFGLFDAVLIKDNHIAAAGGVANAVDRARDAAGHMIKVEVEVDTLDQLDELLTLQADAVLLDNMTLDQLREAVSRASGRLITEASGGVNLETVREIAETGVDLISVGRLTHSPQALDLGLDFVD